VRHFGVASGGLIGEGRFPKQVQLSERTSACLGGKWGRNLYGRSDR
jgi:hypothetical protein